MAKIADERIARYRKLGQRSALQLKNKELGGYFQRAEAEGCKIFSYPFNLQGKEWGFFRAPYQQDLADVDIACVGIPLDSSVPNFAGTRHGPEAVRRWSHLQGPMHHVTGHIPFEHCSIVEYGDVEFSGFNHSDRLNDIYRTYSRIKDADVFTLSIGGEHTVTYPILKALARDEPLALIHIDAHCDTTGLFSDDPAETHDGNFVTRCVMEGLVDPEKVIQIGIRGAGSWAWEFSEDTGMRIVYAEEVARRGIQAIIAEVREIVGSHKCYLTLDVDAIEPTFMPATTAPEPFGLTPWDVRDLIRGVHGLSIVGADIVEISPPRDSQEISANLGAALAFELLCILSESRLARTGRKRRTHWRR